MKKTHTLLTLALGIVLAGTLAASSSAAVFNPLTAEPNVTMAPGSAALGAVPATTSDILELTGGAPTIMTTGGGAPPVVNAHTYGRLTTGSGGGPPGAPDLIDVGVAYFTGIGGGAGNTGGFLAEITATDETAGIFQVGTPGGMALVPLGPGANATFQNVAGTAPFGGTGLTGGGADVINSLDIIGEPTTAQPVWFSTVGIADILVGGPPTTGYAGAGAVAVGAATLGLVSGSDDIDALEVVSTAAGTAYFFSLTGASAVLTGAPSVYAGGSGADIFLFDPAAIFGGAALSKYLDAAGLGLDPLSDVTGFSLAPEPSRALFLLLGTMGIVLRRRRRA